LLEQEGEAACYAASAPGMAASRGRSRGGNSRLHAPAATPSSARRASVVAPRMMYSLTSITEIATPTSRQSGPRPPPSRSSSCIPPSISRRAICSRAPLDLDHPEVPQDVLHAQPDGRIVGGTPPEMIPEPDEFALGQAWGHQDRPLAMPAGHEDRHAAAPIKSRLRADESRMNVSTAVGPWIGGSRSRPILVPERCGASPRVGLGANASTRLGCHTRRRLRRPCSERFAHLDQKSFIESAASRDPGCR